MACYSVSIGFHETPHNPNFYRWTLRGGELKQLSILPWKLVDLAFELRSALRQSLCSSNHNEADLWAHVWPACWVHRKKRQKEKHIFLLWCLFVSRLSAGWSLEESNPSHLLLSATDILIKCFGGLYHAINTPSSFLSLGEKKSELKFLSTVQIPAIDFCSCF